MNENQNMNIHHQVRTSQKKIAYPGWMTKAFRASSSALILFVSQWTAALDGAYAALGIGA